MTKLLAKLKLGNDTLGEMYVGMMAYGLLCQLPGFFLGDFALTYSVSLWIGVVLSAASLCHMYVTLDRGLDLPEKQASKKIFTGYVTRYVLFTIVLVISAFLPITNPLVVFEGYFALKVSAFLQPFTHRFMNMLKKER